MEILSSKMGSFELFFAIINYIYIFIYLFIITVKVITGKENKKVGRLLGDQQLLTASVWLEKYINSHNHLVVMIIIYNH
jgi:hypothetical protein